MKIGLIDIGSNTCKLLIAEKNILSPGQCFDVVEQTSLPCRLLPQSAEEPFEIGHHAIESLVVCLDIFQKTCADHSVVQIKAVATEALRKSANSLFILKEIEEKVGLKVQILSGIEEAKAVALGLQTDPIIKNWHDYIAIDIGGGSTEVIEVKNKRVHQIKSLPIGAVRLAYLSQNNSGGAVNEEMEKKVRKHIQNTLQTELNSFSFFEHNCLAATGGTIVFLRKILEKEQPLRSPSKIERVNVEEIARKTSAVSTKERISLFPAIPPDRAYIFPYGLFAILEMMSFGGFENLTHSFHNLRYGLVQECFER